MWRAMQAPPNEKPQKRALPSESGGRGAKGSSPSPDKIDVREAANKTPPKIDGVRGLPSDGPKAAFVAFGAGANLAPAKKPQTSAVLGFRI
jgi:hypothetical protein